MGCKFIVSFEDLRSKVKFLVLLTKILGLYLQPPNSMNDKTIRRLNLTPIRNMSRSIIPHTNEQNKEEAIKWLALAADKGHLAAQAELGRCARF